MLSVAWPQPKGPTSACGGIAADACYVGHYCVFVDLTCCRLRAMYNLLSFIRLLSLAHSVKLAWYRRWQIRLFSIKLILMPITAHGAGLSAHLGVSEQIVTGGSARMCQLATGGRRGSRKLEFSVRHDVIILHQQGCIIEILHIIVGQITPSCTSWVDDLVD